MNKDIPLEVELPPDVSEPMPHWLDKEIFFTAMKKFTAIHKETNQAYFEKKFPQLQLSELDAVSEAFARMFFIFSIITEYREVFDSKISSTIKDLDVSAMMEPKVELDGKEISTIIDVPDDKLKDLNLTGATIYLNAQAVMREILQGIRSHTLDQVLRKYEETAVEEVAHVAYLNWSFENPIRWNALMEEMKKVNQKMDFSAQEFMRTDELLQYFDMKMEQHGQKWVSSYQEHFYPTEKSQS